MPPAWTAPAALVEEAEGVGVGVVGVEAAEDELDEVEDSEVEDSDDEVGSVSWVARKGGMRGLLTAGQIGADAVGDGGGLC